MNLENHLARISHFKSDNRDYLWELEHLRWRASLSPDYQPLTPSGRRDLLLALSMPEKDWLDKMILNTRIAIAEEGVEFQTKRNGRPDTWLVVYLQELKQSVSAI